MPVTDPEMFEAYGYGDPRPGDYTGYVDGQGVDPYGTYTFTHVVLDGVSLYPECSWELRADGLYLRSVGSMG